MDIPRAVVDGVVEEVSLDVVSGDVEASEDMDGEGARNEILWRALEGSSLGSNVA